MSNELMVDVETLAADSSPRVVLSIGAVLFDPYEEVSPEDLATEGFQIFLDPQAQLNAGHKVDWDTLMWWHNQDAVVRQDMFNPNRKDRAKPYEALLELNAYIKSKGECTHIWGNGPSFDCVILHELYRTFGVKDPFPYYTQQCVRTIGKAAGMKKTGWGTAHDALDDAVAQAVYVQRCYKQLKVGRKG